MMAAVDDNTNLHFEEDYFNEFMDKGAYFNTLYKELNYYDFDYWAI